jgi:hypothetical protein
VVESFINKDTVFEKLPAYLNDTLIYTVWGLNKTFSTIIYSPSSLPLFGWISNIWGYSSSIRPHLHWTEVLQGLDTVISLIN